MHAQANVKKTYLSSSSKLSDVWSHFIFSSSLKWRDLSTPTQYEWLSKIRLEAIKQEVLITKPTYSATGSGLRGWTRDITCCMDCWMPLSPFSFTVGGLQKTIQSRRVNQRRRSVKDRQAVCLGEATQMPKYCICSPIGKQSPPQPTVQYLLKNRIEQTQKVILQLLMGKKIHFHFVDRFQDF